MKSQITKLEAQAFRARWEAVNAAERKELRATSIAHKLRQLAALMASAKRLEWTEALAAEENEVRDRWNRLRKAFCNRFTRHRMPRSPNASNTLETDS